MSYKIFFSNIGYAKGIDGSLRQHISLAGRHFYCSLPVQEEILAQVKALIDAEQPDLCCLVEIDQGSFHSSGFNQIKGLVDSTYHFHDIADKYGHQSFLGRIWFHRGKSNAFLSRHVFSFERLYFKFGTKRLLYRLDISDDLVVFFAHFSLNQKTRQKQFEELRFWIGRESKEVIILADFNIFKGFRELDFLMKDSGLRILNDEKNHTFTFSRRKLTLDLCICSESLVEKSFLKIIPQPFSDHAALLLDLRGN